MCNLDSLLEELYANKDWRITELRDILSDIENSIESKKQPLFLRSIIPMIYAHWEGFVVSSIKKYFECLNKYNFSVESLNIKYLTTALEEKLENVLKSQNFNKREKHLNILLTLLSKKISFRSKIDTKSNLNFDNLINICEKLDFDIEKFKNYKSDLNYLVNIRNAIAHGDTPSFDFDQIEDIEKYICLVDDLMLDFISEIEDAMKLKKFNKES